MTHTAESLYKHYIHSNNDICEHLGTLRDYAERCEVVVELGVRSIVSTWALLLAMPRVLISVDMAHPSQYKDHDPMGGNLDLVYSEAVRLGVSYTFLLTNSITAAVPICDLIFFDTVHTYGQLSRELAAHGSKARKWLIFHDTATFAEELMPAINEWTGSQPWVTEQIFENNNGLIILRRIP